MKKRNTAIRALAVLMICTMFGTSVPAAGQEVFESGVRQETEENISDVEEFQSSQADEFGTDAESDAELFGSDDAKQEFQDGEATEENTDGIRYIKGRPLTEEERKEELEPFKNLKPIDPGPEVESDLTSVYAAYGSRETAFPSSYDSRKEGLVTSVKNQNPFGTCWAFGMAAIMETSLLAQNKGTYDLSEEHLSYFFSNRQNDPLGNTPDDVNSVLGDYHEIGGNDYLAAIYLSTWSGMTTEDDVPFPTDSLHQQNLSVQIPESKAYNSVAYLKNASFSKYSEERMKEMLLNDHAVSIMLYMKESYVNPDTAAYCYPVGKSSSTVINHIVTVVGWDDNYSKNNFLPVSNVTSDGAWIIKNSWGENKGDGGYYYLSYQDPNISNLVSAEAVTVSDQKYNNNYFYDGSSAISSIKVQPGQSVSVVYETKAGNGNEEALGEINVVTMNDNASYKIQVYTDLTDLSDPESGTAAYTQPCEVEQPVAGVQTVTVPEVMLKQGSRYSVVITNSGISYISFGVEANAGYKTSGGSKWFTSTAGIESGQTFHKGASATAEWSDGKTKNWTVRIKAHTRTLNQSWVPDTPVFQVKAYNSGYNLVSWKKVSKATGYYVYRKPAAGGKWSKIADVGTSTLKYKDSKVKANASYRYTVKAYYEASGKRYYSKYTTGDVVKAAPSLQKISSVKSEKKGIRIRWNPQKKCNGYYIYRKKKGGSYQLIKRISGGNLSSYLDKKAQKGVSYYYAVKAYVKEPYGNTYSKYKSSSAVKRK